MDNQTGMVPASDQPAESAPPAVGNPIDDPWGEVEVSLSFKEVKVTVADESQSPPLKRRFIMRELTGAARDLYLNDSGKRMTVDKEGYQVVTDYTGSCANLLSRMMYEVNNVDGKDVVAPQPLAMDKIQLWPSAVQLKLYRRAQEISGLHEHAEDDAKKPSPEVNGPGGSI